MERAEPLTGRSARLGFEAIGSDRTRGERTAATRAVGALPGNERPEHGGGYLETGGFGTSKLLSSRRSSSYLARLMGKLWK